MPKAFRKDRGARRNLYNNGHSDDDSINDNASVISNVSENRSGEEGEDAEYLAQEQLEEKLLELIDGLTQKSSQGRTNCFQSLTKAFIKKYMPSFIRERYFTMSDTVERSLKKGGGPEKTAAAELATVMIVQLAGEESSEEIYRLLKPVLLATACDNSVGASVRSMCCTALAQITFMSMADMSDALHIMQQFETIFAGSYLKGDGSLPIVTADAAALHAAALSAWSLLFILMPTGNVSSMISKRLPSLEKISELLESPHLDVRMAAGETLAIIFELGREESDDFQEDFALDLAETLKQLATDSHKYRAKKDRKVQRASFRDILNFIENNAISELNVKFGTKGIIIDTWAKRKQYESLCNILGPGINVHLAENELLQDFFEVVEEPLMSFAPVGQLQAVRHKKRELNAANFKARTLSRAKNRDRKANF